MVWADWFVDWNDGVNARRETDQEPGNESSRIGQQRTRRQILLEVRHDFNSAQKEKERALVASARCMRPPHQRAPSVRRTAPDPTLFTKR